MNYLIILLKVHQRTSSPKKIVAEKLGSKIVDRINLFVIAVSLIILFPAFFVFVVLLRIITDFIEILFVIFVAELQSFLIVFVIFYHNFILFVILRNIKIKCKILIFFGFVNFFHIFLIFIIKEFLVFPNAFLNFLFFFISHQLHFLKF